MRGCDDLQVFKQVLVIQSFFEKTPLIDEKMTFVFWGLEFQKKTKIGHFCKRFTNMSKIYLV